MSSNNNIKNTENEGDEAGCDTNEEELVMESPPKTRSNMAMYDTSEITMTESETKDDNLEFSFEGGVKRSCGTAVDIRPPMMEKSISLGFDPSDASDPSLAPQIPISSQLSQLLVSQFEPVVVQGRPLEPEPIYYEKYSSFTSSSQPQELLAAISQQFTARTNVDHEPSFEKNKIKGVAYENNGRCTFKISLFQGKTAGSVLCEFQRRSGCVVSFNKFYRRTIASIPAHVETKKTEKSCDWLSNMERIEAQEDSVELDVTTASNLISMAGCDNVDVQREGAQALANIIQSAKNKEKLLEMRDSSLPLVQKLLGSFDTELCRSGCVILDNMASMTNMREQLVSCLGSMVAILDAPVSFETIDCSRRVFSALEQLSTTHAAEMASNPAGSQCINVLKRYVTDMTMWVHTDPAALSTVQRSYGQLHNAAQFC